MMTLKKMHTKNEFPNLLNFGDSCEEDLKIGIWKTTSTIQHLFFNNNEIFPQYFFWG